VSKNKAKGTAEETLVTNYLNDNGILAMRNPPQGAKDKGDINLVSIPVVIEVKNHARMELASWLDEANTEKFNAGAEIGVVWHKRARKGSPGQHYVTLDGESFLVLLKKAFPV